MKKLIALLAALGMASAVQAANLPNVAAPTDPSQIVFIMNSLVQSINNLITPTSMAPLSNFRNYLDNGEFQVTQRGTTLTTGAVNAGIVSVNYAADRWAIQTNVAAGAGRGQVTTATPTPPPGFSKQMAVTRASGALLQPVCAIQEIPTNDVVDLQGQNTILSFYGAALAGLSADNGNVISATIITGTGTDEGLGTPTASPAITPAWTGLATLATQNFTLTTSYSRYTMTPALIATTVNEIAIAICFTPTATGAGVTDGFAVTGVQYEPTTGSNTVASSFEYRPNGVEVVKAQRYFWRVAESAAITPIAPCAASDTTHAQCLLQFPVTMFKVPTMTYTAGFATQTTTALTTLGNCSALATSATVASTAANAQNVSIQCTATTVPAAGTSTQLFSNNGSGAINASADF